MFAPPVAKPTSAAPQRSAVAAQRPDLAAIAQQQSLQQTTGDRIPARRASPHDNNDAGREAAPSWDFGKVPVFSSSHAERLQRPPLFPVPHFPGPIQAKLKVGAVNDPLEHEADRVADQVMHMPAPEVSAAAPPQVSRKCAECEEEEKLQKKPAAPQAGGSEAPALVHEVLRLPGQPLDAETRGFFESRFGHDFSRVRVYTGASAERSTRKVNAHAYTVGRSMVFDAGRFAPGTQEGRQLIAHELTHVLQQSGSDGIRSDQSSKASGAFSADSCATVRRQAKKPAPAGPGPVKKAAKSTPATAPKLTLTPSKNGPPCACLVVVHNDERNARKTAGLMHDNCSYNLALVEPDSGGRLVKIPGHGGQTDPNSLFPRDIAEKCLDNEQDCRDFLKTKAGTTDKDEIEKFVQIQFFLAISDCSNMFALPVVALHNNDIEDTKNYLKQKDKAGVSDLKLDVDKDKKETGEDQIDKLKALMKKKFGEGVEKETMETKGKTNIFRWCASADLSRCHIGDPDHPDNVTWVTTQKDFEALSKKAVNVALQSDVTKSAGSESEGDLSTLFLVLKDILNVRLVKAVEELEQGKANWDELDRMLDEMEKLSKTKDLTGLDLLLRIIDILVLLIDILLNRGAVLVNRVGTAARIDKLRYINIEGPGKRIGDLTDAERIRNYEAIVEVLKTAGLHCCGDDPKKAEDKIKGGLKEGA